MTKFKFDKENEQWVELPDHNNLTKREKFAMAAMQGILSTGVEGEDTVAHNAIVYADSLLKKLEDTQ